MHMSTRFKRSVPVALIASLGVVTAAFAAQPIKNGVYSYSRGSGAHQTGLDLDMSGSHKLSIYLACGALGSAGRSNLGPAYEWTSTNDATVKADGSFSYNGKAHGSLRTGRFHQQVTILHGHMNASGRFVSSQLATGTAKAGKCSAHFSAQALSPEGNPYGI